MERRGGIKYIVHGLMNLRDKCKINKYPMGYDVCVANTHQTLAIMNIYFLGIPSRGNTLQFLFPRDLPSLQCPKTARPSSTYKTASKLAQTTQAILDFPYLKLLHWRAEKPRLSPFHQ